MRPPSEPKATHRIRLEERDEAVPLPHGRGDEFQHGSRPDPRDSIKAKTRDFR